MNLIHFKSFTLFFSLLLLIGLPQSQAQIEQNGIPLAKKYELPLESLMGSRLALPLNLEQMEERDYLLSRETPPGEAMHAGFALQAGINPQTHGQWQTINDSLHVWQMMVSSPGAEGIGLIFENFHLSKGAKLFIYNPSLSYVIGGFTHLNNNEHLLMSTQLIPGDAVIIEYQETVYQNSDLMSESTFVIEDLIHVTQGTIDLTDSRNLGNSGPCQVNINCSEGDLWHREKRGVARMLMRVGNNFFWCSGSLVNNVNQDAMPYFLTAEHCGRNASGDDMLAWQFYFNFERPSCYNVGTPAHNVMHGAYLLSEGPLLNGSDFKLLLLQQEPPLSWRPYYNGWNRLDIASDSGVGIHHPAGDAKKISTYNQTLVSSGPVVSGQPMADDSAWRVVWTETENGHGVSEGGSSGSPLFNAQGLIVGTLTGGSSNCNNTGNPDFYGKMSYHWDQNSEYMFEQVKWFLDPDETGVTELPGYDPYIQQYPPPGFVSASIADNDAVEIKWLKPGQSPNNPGWHAYSHSFVNQTNLGPERATIFNAYTFGLNYPITVTKLSHIFFHQPGSPWSSNEFRYKVYDHTGITILYQSPILEAESLVEAVYELEEPLTFEDKFYVAIAPTHPSGAPSSTYQFINHGHGVSFNGSADNWQVTGNNEYQFAYLSKIYIEDQTNRKEEIELSNAVEVANVDNRWTNSAIQYNIFKNNTFIQSIDAFEAESLSYIDEEGPTGNIYDTYSITAVYPDGLHSGFSNTAYLFHMDLCNDIVEDYPYQETFEENNIPDCWTVESDNEGWLTTDQVNVEGVDITAQTADYFTYVHHSGDETSENWLISPPFDVSGMEKPALSFWFNGNKATGNDGLLALYVSSNGGSFNKLWDANEHPDYRASNAYQWLRTVKDLANFKHGELRIAFLVEGNNACFTAVDNIEVTDATDQVVRLQVIMTPEHTGEVYGEGRFLAGQKVSVRAEPKTGYYFHYWSHQGQFLSNEKDYSFIMPDEDYLVIALFDPDVPTFVDELDPKGGDITVFPNPTSNRVNVFFNNDKQNAHIKLIDTRGKQLLHHNKKDIIAGETLTLDISDLRSGLYYIVVRDNTGQQTIPLSVQK